MMVPKDNGGHIIAIYSSFVKVFSKTKEETLPPDRSVDHTIDLEHCNNLPFGQIYNPSEFELSMVMA
jgi:hypothetical protein